jgi:recombinational DNA repair protein (RecF pathway)
MPSLLEAEGLVLDRVPAGERHQRLTLLTPTLGLIAVLARESRPAGASPGSAKKTANVSQRPDIFDHASVRLESPESGSAHQRVHFLAEYKVLRRHAGLGRSYAALQAASGLAKLIAHNAMHFETCAPVFDLCRKALDALDTGAPPEAVRLKALFILAREEGYAALEQWLPALNAADQELARAVLSRPAAKAAALVAGDTARLPKMRENFERWLVAHTDLEVK